jgi:hypothetical protein
LGVSTVFATLPWLGAGVGSLYCDAVDAQLPTLGLSDTSITGGLARGLYDLAAMPLHLIALAGDDFEYFVNWPSGRHVRPFSFFLFWLVPTACLGCCLLLARLRRSPKQQLPSPALRDDLS